MLISHGLVRGQDLLRVRPPVRMIAAGIRRRPLPPLFVVYFSPPSTRINSSAWRDSGLPSGPTPLGMRAAPASTYCPLPSLGALTVWRISITPTFGKSISALIPRVSDTCAPELTV